MNSSPQKTKIVFMGTPDFACPTLFGLKKHGYDIKLVITQPDKPVGRKKVITKPPIKKLAEKLNLPIKQPLSVSSNEIVNTIRNIKPDYIIVVAFGQILPQSILEIPSKHPINIHASLLPKHRGASPIQASILNGNDQTGVTIMKMDKSMDTGDIFSQSKITISKNDNLETLHDKLSLLGKNILLQTLPKISEKTIIPIPQDNSLASYCKIISKENGRINWNKSAKYILNQIKAYTPWPGSYTEITLNNKKKKLILTKASVTGIKSKEKPGTLIVKNKQILFSTSDYYVNIVELKLDSGKNITNTDFINGFANYL